MSVTRPCCAGSLLCGLTTCRAFSGHTASVSIRAQTWRRLTHSRFLRSALPLCSSVSCSSSLSPGACRSYEETANVFESCTLGFEGDRSGSRGENVRIVWNAAGVAWRKSIDFCEKMALAGADGAAEMKLQLPARARKAQECYLRGMNTVDGREPSDQELGKLWESLRMVFLNCTEAHIGPARATMIIAVEQLLAASGMNPSLSSEDLIYFSSVAMAAIMMKEDAQRGQGMALIAGAAGSAGAAGAAGAPPGPAEVRAWARRVLRRIGSSCASAAELQRAIAALVPVEMISMASDEPVQSRNLGVGLRSAKDQVKSTFTATTLQICNVCGKQTQGLRCVSCGLAVYCSKACQRQHWPQHKALCKRTKKEKKEAAAKKAAAAGGAEESKGD